MNNELTSGLIGVENARNMDRKMLVDTFIPTKNFYRLLSPKNHVIIGSRGSGKTALAKMISHDHLSELCKKKEIDRKEIDTQKYIGIYVATKTEWVSTLKNKPWSNESEKENFFQWRLNIATCLALLKTLRSCLNEFIPEEINRFEKERVIVQRLSNSWFNSDFKINSIVDLRERLEDIEYKKNQQLTRLRTQGKSFEDHQSVGVSFEGELFITLKRGIQLIKRSLPELSDSTWILCIDETEFLDKSMHRILNSYMRADSEDLTFKLTTTPYRHYTLDTNSAAPLRVGHDFDYIYIDKKTSYSKQYNFVKNLFSKLVARLDNSYESLTLENLLGGSTLLESKNNDWEKDAKEMQLLRKYGTDALIKRAERLHKNHRTRFKNEIARKIHGLLKLKEAVEKDVGHKNLDIYSGVKMLVRCSDGNPRRAIRLLNELFDKLELSNLGNDKPYVVKNVQTEVFIKYSADILERTRSELDCGKELNNFLKAFGSYLKNDVHEKEFTGDVYSSFEYDDSINPTFWKVIESAVEWGLLFPVVNKNNPNFLPIKEGKFHLANVLAPNFRLLPRKGSVASMRSILNFNPSTSKIAALGKDQLGLRFDEQE